MPEIINVSLSHQANHLNTHFYNSQEKHLNYSGQKTEDEFDLSVFNHPVKSPTTKTVSYTPRIMLWDMRNGFGALDELETYNESLLHSSEKIYSTYGIETWESNIEQINIGNKPQKGDYQKALDNMSLTPKLGPENTKYWSDYSRMIYSPKSFNTLKNWEIDPEKYPQGRNKFHYDDKGFKSFDLGVKEWDDNEFNVDYMDDKFRQLLENCDNVSGLNFTTECDSGWGGMAHEILPMIKDEFLNKTTIFAWGLYDDTTKDLLTRIKSTVSLIEESGLFFPIANPKYPRTFQANDSTWFTTAVKSLGYDTVMTLFCNEENYSMAELEMGLNLGSKRNMVTDFEIAFGDGNTFIDTNFEKLNLSLFDEPQKHIFSKSLITRPGEEFNESVVIENFGNFTNLNENGVSLRGLTTYLNPVSFKKPETFPSGVPIREKDTLAVSLSIGTKARLRMLEYKKLVSRLLRKNSDEKEELMDKLATIALEYEWGYESDFSDDDYF